MGQLVVEHLVRERLRVEVDLAEPRLRHLCVRGTQEPSLFRGRREEIHRNHSIICRQIPVLLDASQRSIAILRQKRHPMGGMLGVMIHATAADARRGAELGADRRSGAPVPQPPAPESAGHAEASSRYERQQ